ncbi:hypothetical protein PYW07_002795 [Mythimna separata]|uniref:Uncharacterized protein n=1 Tax=Mythimna separata TaxID=271217 RepID=A0AAD7YFZ5_MYTSE|nr:hypothetical protein PYW07_002795 [Mythimna separata]
MKLLLIFAAILAFSLAEEEKKTEALDDSQAEASASIELLKEGADLTPAASTYNSYVPPSQRPPHWNAPNYVPQNTWQPPKPIQAVQTGVPGNVQADYPQYWPSPVTHPPTTTTPIPVIKNEQYFGDNGYYKYEYKIADGTWVGEEGYYTDPKQTEESLVKKGWYSYVGADKKTYTVTYWADHTGYHAYGDHLPTPPPATQPANKPQYDEYPAQSPAPVNYPTQTPPPIYKPTYTPEPIYYPTKAPVAPPVYVPPQVQPTYTPPQQPSYPPLQPAYPPQQPSYPPQQQYFPPQQNYYPQQPTNQV